MTLVRSFDDVTDKQVGWILERAGEHRSRRTVPEPNTGLVLGLAFFEPSLRTRVGFAAAAARLGIAVVEVHEIRSSAVSMPESIDDTLRTLAGYCDVVVARTPSPLTALPPGVRIPVLSGGDRGAAAEHPSQALIDLFALSRTGRRVEELAIALCGDLRMRAAQSVLRAFARRPPGRLLLVTEPELRKGLTVPDQLAELVEYRSLVDSTDVDVLSVVGIPHAALSEDGRARLRVTREVLDALGDHAVVISPMPVIDEIDRSSVNHPRIRMFEQSDDALFVRMALLELLLR